MAIKVIKKPAKSFAMECDKCGCEFTYGLDDLLMSFSSWFVACPICGERCMHILRKSQEDIRYEETHSN